MVDSPLHEVQQPAARIATYVAPATLRDALDALDHYGERARPVAGGTDLLVELDRGGRAGIDTLVDLGRIPGLAEIGGDADTIELGPLVTHNQVVASERCRVGATPLAQACLEVGSPQLRNRATVAGNLVTASPANDTISALLALRATVELTSATGTRTLALDDFLTGFRTTALAPGELVTSIRVPRLDAPRPAPDVSRRGIFVKLGLRRAQAISVVHLAAVVTLADELVTDATFAIGSVAPTVALIPGVGEALVGHRLDATAVADAAAAVVAAIAPIDDLRASADYRTDVAATMTRRALLALGRGEQLATWPPAPPLLWGRSFSGQFPTGLGVTTLTAADTITTTVNGRVVTGTDAAGSNLLDWLRRHAEALGVKEGCAEGECGACTVDLDGAAVMSCLVPAARAHDAEIVTVEGLAPEGALHPVQAAFLDCSAVQCGFCTPGLVMAAAKLLDEQPTPTRDQISAGLSGNLCRCTGYKAIESAVELAGGAT